MKLGVRVAAVSVAPGLVLFIAFVGYVAFDVYVRGNCDTKFGCAGSIHFAAFITGLMLACSLSGHMLAGVAFRNTLRAIRTKALWGVVAALSLGQGALFASMEHVLPASSVPHMLMAWAAISCGVALVVFLSCVAGRSAHPPAPRWE
jgi:hypothetical protein